MDQENFFVRLKNLRESVGWSQKEFGKEIGVSSNTVQSWEKDTYPKGDALIRISELLNCSIDWLLTGEGDSIYMPAHLVMRESSNVYELQHMALVRGFQDKQRALSINKNLIELESLDNETFKHIDGYINGTVDVLRRMNQKKQDQSQEESQPKRADEAA